MNFNLEYLRILYTVNTSILLSLLLAFATPDLNPLPLTGATTTMVASAVGSTRLVTIRECMEGGKYRLLYHYEHLGTAPEGGVNKLNLGPFSEADGHIKLSASGHLTVSIGGKEEQFDLNPDQATVSDIMSENIVAVEVLPFRKVNTKDILVGPPVKGKAFVPIGMTKDSFTALGTNQAVYLTTGNISYEGRPYRNPVVVYDQHGVFIFGK